MSIRNLKLMVCVATLALLTFQTSLSAAEIPFQSMVALAQANGYLVTGQYDRAANVYRQVTTHHPNAGLAWSGLGRAYLMEGQPEDAIDPLERAIKLCYDKQEPWNLLGNAYYHLDEYERAERCYSESLAVVEDAIVYYNRGNARNLDGRYSAAIEDFTQAIAIDDTDSDFFNDRGIAYWNLEDWHQAATDFSKAAGMDPENEVIVQNYCGAVENMSAWSAMVQSGEVLLRKAPNNSATHYMLALGQWNLGNVNAARRTVDRAIELDSEQYEYYELRAEILRRLGRVSEARRDEQQAERLQE